MAPGRLAGEPTTIIGVPPDPDYVQVPTASRERVDVEEQLLGRLRRVLPVGRPFSVVGHVVFFGFNAPVVEGGTLAPPPSLPLSVAGPSCRGTAHPAAAARAP